ncbi:Hypothetical predicted protein, partial [Paramuricea clavata]
HCLQISEDCLLQHIQREHYQACVGCTNFPHESSESGSLEDDSEEDLGSDMEKENL